MCMCACVHVCTCVCVCVCVCVGVMDAHLLMMSVLCVFFGRQFMSACDRV